jgi:secernin
MVVLPARSATGATIFAKNSDRPPRECQPLFQAPRIKHPAGARLRCQYLELPQVEETLALIGSRPAWLWGFEHGVNEYGVAIGNEALATKESLPEIGLLGMDLVRLALERTKTAREAVELIGGFVERYGQGGSNAYEFDWRYSNGFIIADPAEAWTLETSGRQWAAKKVNECASISNRPSTNSYDLASPEVREYARERGFWDGRRAFDFSAAYTEEAHPTTFSANARLARSRELLSRDGKLSVRDMVAFLRDHYEAGEMPIIAAPPESERHFSLCMHTAFAATTASVVAELPSPESRRTPVMWVSMAAPCTGIFFPLYVAGKIPDALTRASMEPSADFPWWHMKSIQDAVARDPERLAPGVWKHFRPLESEFFEREADIERKVLHLNGAERSQLLTAFMAQNVARVLDAASRVESELQREA